MFPCNPEPITVVVNATAGTTVTGAFNVNGATDLNGTLNVDGATTINNSFTVDSNGTGTAGGNRITVDGSGINALSNNSLFGSSISDTGELIGYNNSTTGVTSGLSTDDTDLVVGYTDSTIGTNGIAYGLHTDSNEVNVEYVVYGNGSTTENVFHGLTVTDSQTTLTGGTNSSSLTLADNAATLAVGTSTTSEISLIRAANDGTDTNVSIGEESGNRIDLNSLTGTAVTGDFSVNAGGGTSEFTVGTDSVTIVGATSITGETNINTIGTAGATNTITGANNNITATTSNTMGVTGDSSVTTTATQLTAVTADGSGLAVNNGGDVSVLNNTGHGLTVSPTETVVSGGTTPTTLTLGNSGATFANTATGGPARVTSIADGINNYDAVNIHQFRTMEDLANMRFTSIEDSIQKANIGITSVSALAAIPAVLPGKRFAIGAGYGYFESENTVAFGMKANFGDHLSVTAGVGFGVGRSDSTYSANAGFSLSF